MPIYLGKITDVRLGDGGYQDAMFGLTVGLSFDGYGSQVFFGTWKKRSDRAQFSAEEWNAERLKAFDKLQELMSQAKVNDINKLVGIPVEVTSENMTVKDWRILTEVL